jgi:hypothetical protein
LTYANKHEHADVDPVRDDAPQIPRWPRLVAAVALDLVRRGSSKSQMVVSVQHNRGLLTGMGVPMLLLDVAAQVGAVSRQRVNIAVVVALPQRLDRHLARIGRVVLRTDPADPRHACNEADELKYLV